MSDQKNEAPQAEEKPSAPKTTKRTAPEIKVPVAAPADPNAAAVKVQVRNRHDAAFRHDIFVSDSQAGIRNVSFVHLKPELIKIEHKHIYHSHNSNGKKQSRTGSAIGHWHDVTHYEDPRTGEIIAKCGPPMHEVVFISASGATIRRIEQVGFEREILVGKDAGSSEMQIDDHTHKMEYLGSEELSPLGVQKDLKAQQGAAAAMGIVLGGGDVKDNTPAPMTPADGATIV